MSPQRFRYQQHGDDQWYWGVVFPTNPNTHEYKYAVVWSESIGEQGLSTTNAPLHTIRAEIADIDRVVWLDRDFEWCKDWEEE